MMLKNRCGWCTSDPVYITYHDSEWGVPVKDDKLLFEMLVLESFQAGLSWITILNKRDNFRKAFDSFDYKKIAKYDKSKVESLMQDKGIVRNRKKIEATINNAKAFLKIQKSHGCFSHFIWSFVNHEPIVNRYTTLEEVPAQTDISKAMAMSLKDNGFSFMGPITCYAFMQATGLVNDHITDCFKHPDNL
ncbi:MAG TPA: DNA-3-methyladenine glycosylase I [Flavobacteriaceae bacterium]|nr:DNA-3-methyladenine glycosylase I [Flavobacteriaceae bacterium]